MKRAHLSLLAAVLVTGCAALGGDPGTGEGELRPLERAMVGAAKPYPADTSLRERYDELRGSMKARREAAWKAIAKVLKPVALAEDGVKVNGGQPTIPLFRTWYGKDDLDRTFAKMYAGIGADGRKARRPFTDDEIARGLDANAKDRGSFGPDDYLARVQGVTDQAGADGLGGNARVSYSPGVFQHMLGDYGDAYGCTSLLPTIDFSAPPPSDTNFATCFAHELPVDAALVKASWWRADFGMKLPTYDTSAATLAQKKDGSLDQGGWGTGVGEADPDGSSVYTISTSDGSRYRMAGMHLITKELREWMWITMWWSPEPDTDFGADRPQEIRDLGGPWGSYKMCVVTSYDEGDPDPRGGFDGTLGDALAAVHEGAGGPTWCANPYLEKGAKNAQTNCIGCHQHGGDPSLTSEKILADEARFPKSGRTKLQTAFPADYVWSFYGKPEQLVDSMARQIAHYDTVDR